MNEKNINSIGDLTISISLSDFKFLKSNLDRLIYLSQYYRSYVPKDVLESDKEGVFLGSLRNACYPILRNVSEQAVSAGFMPLDVDEFFYVSKLD